MAGEVMKFKIGDQVWCWDTLDETCGTTGFRGEILELIDKNLVGVKTQHRTVKTFSTCAVELFDEKINYKEQEIVMNAMMKFKNSSMGEKKKMLEKLGFLETKQETTRVDPFSMPNEGEEWDGTLCKNFDECWCRQCQCQPDNE
jgi:hypothetical protein